MIRLDHVNLRAGAFGLRGISFEVPAGCYAVLMGRTGTGKTTILEAIAGLRAIESGSIHLEGRDVTTLKPAQRGIGYVPQDRALFATMTIREHLAFALRIRKWSPARIDQRVGALAGLLGIEHLLGRRPAGLSGGEAQRVALGRALAFSPGILLLDEPLSALDDQTRLEMHDLLLSIKRHTGVTTLHVTHNAEDAQMLADRILVVRDGRVEEPAPQTPTIARVVP
jgi:ABC-type sugar transport system ATPase subunit